MRKRFFMGVTVGMLCVALTACEPSDEKIAEAKEKYVQLAEVHNQVVDAHGNVSDGSLDEELVALKGKAKEIESYNLAEMKDEEIDQLIQTMDFLIEDYGEYLTALSDIKEEEEAAVVTSITLALANHTDFSFSEIFLYKKGDNGDHANVLGDGELVPDQSLTGLIIRRDAEDTPWILVLTDGGGKVFELELPVREYSEKGVSLSLSYDEEQDEIIVS